MRLQTASQVPLNLSRVTLTTCGEPHLASEDPVRSGLTQHRTAGHRCGCHPEGHLNSTWAFQGTPRAQASCWSLLNLVSVGALAFTSVNVSSMAWTGLSVGP